MPVNFIIQHIEVVHDKKKPFKCEICDYSCYQKSKMKKHVESVHEKNEPFKCEICYYSCAQNSNLKRHISSVHEEKKPLRCAICDKEEASIGIDCISFFLSSLLSQDPLPVGEE